jgi:AcrR family transcriptional regulator
MSATKPRQRVPAAERRDALIDAAITEFAQTGLHGTPVDRIARRVGVAQPYVFSLFPTKRDLFIAAVERCFGRVGEAFERAAAEYDPLTAEPEVDLLKAMGLSYIELLRSDRELLMLELQGYASCDDPVIGQHVRAAYAKLLTKLQELSGAEPERIDEFNRLGMSLTIAAAMGVEELGINCDWVTELAK